MTAFLSLARREAPRLRSKNNSACARSTDLTGLLWALNGPLLRSAPMTGSGMRTVRCGVPELTQRGLSCHLSYLAQRQHQKLSFEPVAMHLRAASYEF